jgi:DNA helicase-2/ATP-dependent DNA helicase PcrA
VVDFAELLLRSHRAAGATTPHCSSHYRRRFRHILVDEFQDTNDSSSTAGHRLRGQAPTAPPFAVGDDDQSIYTLPRRAGREPARRSRRDFPAGEPGAISSRTTVRHGIILEAANALIANNGGRLGKNLWTSGRRGEAIRRCGVRRARRRPSSWLASASGRWTRLGRPPPATSPSCTAPTRSRACSKQMLSLGAGIPYKVYGGLRFFERAEIKHALAYLRLRREPATTTPRFERVINLPTRGIGARSVEVRCASRRATRARRCRARPRALRRRRQPRRRGSGGGAGVHAADRPSRRRYRRPRTARSR